MHPYITNTPEQQAAMLRELGFDDFQSLLDQLVPPELQTREALKLPEALSEWEHQTEIARLSRKGADTQQYVSFLGAGAYDHFVPSVVDFLVSRSEFYTAYTPYQPEVSQGTLQAMFEFQSMLCELTGMDAANISLYDGASALAEACLLAARQTGRNQVLVDAGVHPEYLRVALTYAAPQGLELVTLPSENYGSEQTLLSGHLTDETAAVVIQQPNFFGQVQDVIAWRQAIPEKVLLIVIINPVSLGILEAPGAQGADVVIGEGQPLGNHLSFGGPYLGLMAVKQPLVRKMPGRIIGETVDQEGNRAFTMVLRTREQDIRREKATSNICSNQALNALRTGITLAALGRKGVRRLAELNLQKAHYLADRLADLSGWTGPEYPFFNEFVVRTPVPANEIVQTGLVEGFFAGISLERWYPERKNELLLAVTEKRTRREMDALVDFCKKFGNE